MVKFHADRKSADDGVDERISQASHAWASAVRDQWQEVSRYRLGHLQTKFGSKTAKPQECDTVGS